MAKEELTSSGGLLGPSPPLAIEREGRQEQQADEADEQRVEDSGVFQIWSNL